MSTLRTVGLAMAVAALVAGAGMNTVQAASLEDAGASQGAAAKIISFGDLAFDPLAATASPGSTRYRTAANGKGLRFVQFEGAIRGEWLGDLRAFGARPLQYYPHDTYLVWADEPSSRAVESLPDVRWQGDYLPEWKMEPGLRKRDGVIRNVGVHFFNDGDVEGVLAALRASGANVVNHGPAQTDRTFFDAWVEVDADHLDKLAEIPQVVWLEYASARPILDDEMSSQILARNYDASNVPLLGYLGWINNLGYNGDSLVWAVIDTGIDYAHPDFTGRIAGGTSYPGCTVSNPGDDAASGGHGTHVAGIIGGNAAAGFGDAGGFKYGLGMAPSVRFYAQNPICGNGPWPPTGGWQVLAKDALNGGAIGGNASWTSGESGGTTYTAGARAWDQLVRDGNVDTPINEAFIMVFSAGNSGPSPGTLTAPKAAKNPIITGGTQNYRVASNINGVYNASSRGPTQDGRIGITIAAPGQQIASARRIAGGSSCASAIAGTSNHYAFCSGTSMAAPHASGAAVILSDWWRENNGGAQPSPAMVKALLVNGARDYGGGGPIPNATQGWGRVDVPGSLGADFDYSEYVDQTEVLTSVGQVWEATYGVPESGKPLKVSLVWTDAAAAAGANPALVNNLDLEVVTGGQTYLGNVFSGGLSVAGGTADNRHNIENVFVADPGGTVTIRVRASNLPGDGIPNVGGATDQDFALVCRNCIEEAGFSLAVSPSSASICTPDAAAFSIDVGSVLGYQQPVTLAATGHPAGTTATFLPNPVTPLPGSSSLVLGNTASAAPGTYTVTITGTTIDRIQESAVTLLVATAVPDSPVPVTPAPGATNISTSPTLQWAAAPGADEYLVEIATDAAFTDIIHSDVTLGTSLAVGGLSTSTRYYWRVVAQNGCGSAYSFVADFRTLAAPGDCGVDQVAVSLLGEDFSGGLGAFTTTG
ncbi:S8 family serine peptidase, partial [Pseudofulvimonas gallinarii]